MEPCLKQKLTILMNAAQEDRRRGVWGDLRGLGPADAGERGAEGGVGPTTQTGPEDGGRGPQKAAG